jgi:ribosomal protein S18 acetylase RimI-like enzyme
MPARSGRPLSIVEVRGPAAVATARSMMEEYARAIRVDLCFQGFDEELRSLPGGYAPPRGRLKLALWGAVPVGCGALRPRSPRVGELKRLYVRPSHRGRGIGRALSERLLAEAVRIGYRQVVLDTLSTMEEAIGLYRSLGFVETAAYYPNPIPGARYFAWEAPRG